MKSECSGPIFRDDIHSFSSAATWNFFSLTSNLSFYDLVYITLLQHSRPSVPSDDRFLRSRLGRRLGKREIKMIYHPRIAGAHTMKKIRDGFFYAATALMPSPHWPPTTLITELRQRCNTLGLSMATCPAISWWALQH